MTLCIYNNKFDNRQNPKSNIVINRDIFLHESESEYRICSSNGRMTNDQGMAWSMEYGVWRKVGEGVV